MFISVLVTKHRRVVLTGERTRYLVELLKMSACAARIPVTIGLPHVSCTGS
jgi:hypothetical protein